MQQDRPPGANDPNTSLEYAIFRALSDPETPEELAQARLQLEEEARTRTEPPPTGGRGVVHLGPTTT